MIRNLRLLTLLLIFALFALTQPVAADAAALKAGSPPAVKAAGDDPAGEAGRLEELKEILAEHLTARSCILYDPATRKILYSRNPFRAMAPASLTKILTALITLDTVQDLDEIVTVKRNIKIGRGGVALGFKKGDRISVRDLLYCAMLYSANDACVAIAEEISGSVEQFAKLMNTYSRSLGVINSNFANPNGMPDDRHYSTAYDLALLSAAAMKNPAFAEIVGTKNRTVHIQTVVEKRVTTKKQAKKLGLKVGTLISSTPATRDIHLKNRHKLLGKYAGIRGIKTGYTLAAGKCLATDYCLKGRDLIVVVLKSEDPNDDTINLLAYQKERANLPESVELSSAVCE